MADNLENGVMDFNVLIWNLHKNDGVSDSAHRNAIRQVLRRVKKGTSLPTFFLCQESKTDTESREICEELELDHSVTANESQEVNIYPWNVRDQVEFINLDGNCARTVLKLAVMSKETTARPGKTDLGSPLSSTSQTGQRPALPPQKASSNTDKTLLSRLRACIFKPEFAPRVFILSWHSPRKDKQTDKAEPAGTQEPAKSTGQIEIFKKMIRFAELLMVTHGCRLAVIGGGFNISPQAATDGIQELSLSAEAEVYSDYKTSKEVKDFMVVLFGYVTHEVVVTSVHHQYHTGEPFDHSIVRFRLVASPLPVRKQARMRNHSAKTNKQKQQQHL